MCPSNHWTWCFRVFHVSFSLTSKRKAGKKGVEEGGRNWDFLEGNHHFPVSPWTTTNNDTRKHRSIEATKALLFSPHGMSTTTVRGLCLHTLQRSAWMATDQIEPTWPVVPRLSTPSKETAHYGWQNGALEAPLQISWLLRDQAVINWSDNLSNENSINSNRPRWGKLYTVERGEKTHMQE